MKDIPSHFVSWETMFDLQVTIERLLVVFYWFAFDKDEVFPLFNDLVPLASLTGYITDLKLTYKHTVVILVLDFQIRIQYELMRPVLACVMKP